MFAITSKVPPRDGILLSCNCDAYTYVDSDCHLLRCRARAGRSFNLALGIDYDSSRSIEFVEQILYLDVPSRDKHTVILVCR